MSTILSTLKKLEEEKSVLEKNIDLKGLLLQGQEEPIYPQAIENESRKWGVIGGLIIGGILLGGFMVHLLNPEKTNLPETNPVFALKSISPTPRINKPLAPAKTNPGFPLARIQETPSEAMSEMSDPMLDDDFFEPEDALILPLEPSPPDIAESQGSQEIREIESLVQSAIATGETNALDREEIAAFAPNTSPHIPGLKVKGIIFLNSDNPVNHIFVSTPTENNRKLRVGETLLRATLETIEANQAIFSYQGQRVEKTIGE
jgi:hypothetical protein